MGNGDGIASAIANQGQNKKMPIEDGSYFSFALGSEIALVCGGSYYILNCGEELWLQVQRFNFKLIEDAKKWWVEMSKDYNISDWSEDFSTIA